MTILCEMVNIINIIKYPVITLQLILITITKKIIVIIFSSYTRKLINTAIPITHSIKNTINSLYTIILITLKILLYKKIKENIFKIYK